MVSHAAGGGAGGPAEAGEQEPEEEAVGAQLQVDVHARLLELGEAARTGLLGLRGHGGGLR